MARRESTILTREFERLRRPRTALLLGITALLVIYAATATWTADGQTRDARGAALPGWNLVENGSLDLTEYRSDDAWLVETEEGWFSNRAPGLIAVSFLGYLVAAPFTDSFVYWPATAVAVITSTLAIALVAATTRKLGVVWSYWPFVILGLASSVWSIASDQLWPHGPAALLLALALWCLAADRNWLAGVALGLGVLVRPPVAVIALAAGVGLAVYRRSLKPLLQIGVPSSIGALAFLLYNRLIFGSSKPAAPYEAFGGLSTVSETVQGGLNSVLTAFASPRYGVLIWAPWIIVGAVVAWQTRNTLPDWARVLGPAAIAYLVVHVQINRVSGGLPYNYRYAIEALVLATPVLIAGLWHGRSDRLLKSAGILTVLVALTLQTAFVFVSECTGIGTVTPRCGLFGL